MQLSLYLQLTRPQSQSWPGQSSSSPSPRILSRCSCLQTLVRLPHNHKSELPAHTSHRSALRPVGNIHLGHHAPRYSWVVRTHPTPPPKMLTGSSHRLLAPVTLRHNPISTLYELCSLGLLGVFWIGQYPLHLTHPMYDPGSNHVALQHLARTLPVQRWEKSSALPTRTRRNQSKCQDVRVLHRSRRVPPNPFMCSLDRRLPRAVPRARRLFAHQCLPSYVFPHCAVSPI